MASTIGATPVAVVGDGRYVANAAMGVGSVEVGRAKAQDGREKNPFFESKGLSIQKEQDQFLEHRPRNRTKTHTHRYIYIYIYMGNCGCHAPCISWIVLPLFQSPHKEGPLSTKPITTVRIDNFAVTQGHLGPWKSNELHLFLPVPSCTSSSVAAKTLWQKLRRQLLLRHSRGYSVW